MTATPTSPTPPPFRSLSLTQMAFPTPDKLLALTQPDLERDAVPHAELEDALRTINRRFAFPLKGRTLDLYTNARTYLLGNKATVLLPALLPAWRIGSPRGPLGLANAVPYAPAAGAGALDIRKLYSLLQWAAVEVDAFERWPKVVASLPLAQKASVVYARMVHKVVDRVTGVGADRLRSDQIKYVFAKYYVVHLQGRPLGDTTTAVAQAATAGSTPAGLDAFEAAVAAAAGLEAQEQLYALGFLEFVQAVGLAAEWTRRLTARGFVQTFVSLYGAPAYFALEDFAAFLGALASHQANGELLVSFAFDPVFGSEGEDAVGEFARLTR